MAARSALSTLYGYGASLTRNNSWGLRSTARTARDKVRVEESQRPIGSRKNVRDSQNTTTAPESAAQYEITAPVHGPNVYPDNVISVEYSGRGAIKT